MAAAEAYFHQVYLGSLNMFSFIPLNTESLILFSSSLFLRISFGIPDSASFSNFSKEAISSGEARPSINFWMSLSNSVAFIPMLLIGLYRQQDGIPKGKVIFFWKSVKLGLR